MSEIEEYTKEEEYFNDWYSDNKQYLLQGFCDDNELYDQFVRDEFDVFKKELIWENQN